MVLHLLVKKAEDHVEGLLESKIGNSLRTVIPSEYRRKNDRRGTYVKKTL